MKYMCNVLHEMLNIYTYIYMQTTILKPNKRQDPSEVNGQKPKPSEAT